MTHIKICKCDGRDSNEFSQIDRYRQLDMYIDREIVVRQICYCGGKDSQPCSRVNHTIPYTVKNKISKNLKFKGKHNDENFYKNKYNITVSS